MDSNLGNFREAIDHISGLPDAILGHILSFVPTKSSVKTSILSKRWQHVWTKVPALDFTEMPSSNGFEIFYIKLSREHEICFRSFVDRVLLYHDTCYLQHLRLHFGDDGFKFKSWLDAILLRFIIREIDMEVNWNIQQGQLHGQRVLLPASIFSAKKLVILNLSGLFEFDIPISINLPNLEAIHLSLVKLPGDEFMRKLSVNCPALKKLLIFECFGFQTLHVESLTLETLQVISKTAVSIVIKAPSLKSLFLAWTLKPCAIGDLPLLMEANLYLCFANSSDAHLLLRRVSGAKTLQLRISPCLIFESNYPVFQNLTRLAITAEVCTLQILNFAPKLESLIIEKVLCHATLFEGTSMAVHYPAGLSFDRSLMPKLLPCLEHVEFSDFGGWPNEMELVAYFLEVGSALKTMKINTRRFIVSGEDVCQDILMLPRSSATCQVKIVHKEL